MSEPVIQRCPAWTILGYEGAFRHALSPEANNQQVIPELWNRLCGDPVLFDEMQIGNATYGVIYGRPETQRSHPDELQYIAGVKVEATVEPREGLSKHEIPESWFAVFSHHGPMERIHETVRWIYRQWLPASDYEHAGVADVEIYDQRFQPGREDSVMEYSISVRPREVAR